MQRNITASRSSENTTLRNHPLFMQDPLDLSQIDWDIFVTIDEPRTFTEYTLSFKKLLPENTMHAVILCYSEHNTLHVRFLVKGTWADIKRCNISAYQKDLQKYPDLNLTLYKLILNSVDCLNQAACKDDVKRFLQDSISEDNPLLPIKIPRSHPLAFAMNAAMHVLPDKIKNTFNDAYQSALLQETPNANKTSNIPTEPAKIDDPIPTSTAMITTTLALETTESKPAIDIIESKTATQTSSETNDSSSEKIQITTEKQNIGNNTAIILSTPPVTEQAVIPSPNTVTPKNDTKPLESAPQHFLIQLKTLLQQAQTQQNAEFVRHTGLGQLCDALKNLTEDNMNSHYKSLQKITTARSTGLRDWLSNATFFCLCQGRDPAVQALYQFISKTSLNDCNKAAAKTILANLQETLNMGNTKKNKNTCC